MPRSELLHRSIQLLLLTLPLLQTLLEIRLLRRPRLRERGGQLLGHILTGILRKPQMRIITRRRTHRLTGGNHRRIARQRLRGPRIIIHTIGHHDLGLAQRRQIRGLRLEIMRIHTSRRQNRRHLHALTADLRSQRTPLANRSHHTDRPRLRRRLGLRRLAGTPLADTTRRARQQHRRSKQRGSAFAQCTIRSHGHIPPFSRPHVDAADTISYRSARERGRRNL